MTEERDPLLQSLFSESSVELDEDNFTQDVLIETRGLKTLIIAAAISIALILSIVSWYMSAPLQELAIVITESLATRLVDLGDDNLAWLLAPVNNMASLFLIAGKAFRMTWKKVRKANYQY